MSGRSPGRRRRGGNGKDKVPTDLGRLIAKLDYSINNQTSFSAGIKYPKLLLRTLNDLNSTIGNTSMKNKTAEQVNHLIVTRRIQELTGKDVGYKSMINSALFGGPGVGKSMIARRLARVYFAMGFLDGRKPLAKTMADNINADPDAYENFTQQIQNLQTMDILYIIVLVCIVVLYLCSAIFNRFGWIATMIFIVIIIVLALMVYSWASTVMARKNTTADGERRVPTSDESPEIEIDYNEVDPDDNMIFRVVGRNDFVDKYLGGTDKRTLKFLEESRGMVILLDEAYKFCVDDQDRYGKEAVDVLNEWMEVNRSDIIVIFAGYRERMEEGLFAVQPGLKSRCTWKFECEGYSADELYQIFVGQVMNSGYTIEDYRAVHRLILDNYDAFPAFGRDTERLTAMAQMAHSKNSLEEWDEETTNVDDLLLITPEHVETAIANLRANTLKEQRTEPTSRYAELFREMQREQVQAA